MPEYSRDEMEAEFERYVPAHPVGALVHRDVALLTPESTQALSASSRGQPRSEAIGLTDQLEMLCKAQPGRLADVRGVGLIEPVTAGNGPDQARESLDQLRPGPFVPARSLPDQGRHVGISHIAILSNSPEDARCEGTRAAGSRSGSKKFRNGMYQGGQFALCTGDVTARAATRTLTRMYLDGQDRGVVTQ